MFSVKYCSSAVASYKNAFRRHFFPVFKIPLHSICNESSENMNPKQNGESIFNRNMFAPITIMSNIPACNKVTIVGDGAIGITCASAIMMKGITSDICLFRKNVDPDLSESVDLNDGSTLLHHKCRITETDNIKETSESKVIVFTDGHELKPGQSRLELAKSNLDVLKTILPPLIDLSPKAVLIITINPVDIMTLAAWRISELPLQKVIGSGCELESAVFRILLSNQLQLPKENMNAWVIGEHGASICHWSSVSFAGVPLAKINPSIGMPWDSQKWNELQTNLIKTSEKIIAMKGYTKWGVGMSIASIVQSILRNDNNIKCISTLATGRYEIHEEICMSLPWTVGERGIGEMVRLNMSLEEKSQLISSAINLEKCVKELNI